MDNLLNKARMSCRSTEDLAGYFLSVNFTESSITIDIHDVNKYLYESELDVYGASSKIIKEENMKLGMDGSVSPRCASYTAEFDIFGNDTPNDYMAVHKSSRRIRLPYTNIPEMYRSFAVFETFVGLFTEDGTIALNLKEMLERKYDIPYIEMFVYYNHDMQIKVTDKAREILTYALCTEYADTLKWLLGSEVLKLLM